MHDAEEEVACNALLGLDIEVWQVNADLRHAVDFVEHILDREARQSGNIHKRYLVRVEVLLVANQNIAKELDGAQPSRREEELA